MSARWHLKHEARNEREETVQATGWQAGVLWTTNSMEKHSAASHHGGPYWVWWYQPGRFLSVVSKFSLPCYSEAPAGLIKGEQEIQTFYWVSSGYRPDKAASQMQKDFTHKM